MHPNLELINKAWPWLDQHKTDKIILGHFVDLLIKNKPELAVFKYRIILYLMKIEYKDVLFNGEIGKGKLEVDGVACCMLWTAGKHLYGYGWFNLNCGWVTYKDGRIGIDTGVTSHRFMLFLVDPDFDLESELFVCHSCDNPPCCNPNHLWLGTAQDNSDDMVNKGRQSCGNNIILTDDQVLSIINDTDTQEAISIKYGVSISTISNIKTGKRKRKRKLTSSSKITIDDLINL